MAPLVVLLLTFIVSALVSRFSSGDWNLAFSGNLSMCLMLCFTALGHFLYTKGMTMMIPKSIPFKKALVYLTGFLEVLLGIGLLLPGFRFWSGIILVIFFILMLPANINAAINHVDYQKGTTEGAGTNYLWFRVPLQILFIGWVYFFAVSR